LWSENSAVDPAETAPGRALVIDNVPLDLPVAGVGPRSLAAFIDYAAVAAIATSLVVVGLLAGVAVGLHSLWWMAALMLALFAVEYGYFAVSEALMEGQTLGKRTVGLRVVTTHGSRPSTAAVLARNAVRSIDLAVGVLLMAIDPLSRRLGDRLAGTLVVRTGHLAAPTVLARVPRGWNGRQIEVLEGFLQRSAEIEPVQAERLARALLAAIERDDPAFLVPESGRGPIERLRASVADAAS